MFAQGQLLGMKSDLLMRLKTEINSWDKVAERHPYSVYRKNEMPQFSEARRDDPYTTNFGEGLPFRTYDRNQRARTVQSINRSLEQPYPTGYTGHVTRVRHVVGGTNGRMVREAINSVTPAVELVGPNLHVTPAQTLHSTQQLAYLPPDRQLEVTQEQAAAAVTTRRPVDNNSRYASTQRLSFPPPPPRAYATPGWSARPTSNIGQPDTYKHIKQSHVHQAELPRRLAAQSSLQPPSTSSGSQP